MIKAGVHYSFSSNLLKYVFLFIFNIFHQSSKELSDSGLLEFWGEISFKVQKLFPFIMFTR